VAVRIRPQYFCCCAGDLLKGSGGVILPIIGIQYFCFMRLAVPTRVCVRDLKKKWIDKRTTTEIEGAIEGETDRHLDLVTPGEGHVVGTDGDTVAARPRQKISESCVRCFCLKSQKRIQKLPMYFKAAMRTTERFNER
jgi:hypothetical protein